MHNAIRNDLSRVPGETFEELCAGYDSQEKGPKRSQPASPAYAPELAIPALSEQTWKLVWPYQARLSQDSCLCRALWGLPCSFGAT